MDGIFSRFSTVMQSAVDALAPPVPLLDDFIYHWKMLMRFYMNKDTLPKTVIEATSIPAHLDQLLKLLLEEEGDLETGSTGPCLEYFLQHHLLDLLATLACTDCPPGMKQHTFSFVRRLVTQTKQPILPHVGIYVPIQRLIGLCCGTNASPTEKEEVHFLCTLCALLCNDPSLINIFSNLSGDQPTNHAKDDASTLVASATRTDSAMSSPETSSPTHLGPEEKVCANVESAANNVMELDTTETKLPDMRKNNFLLLDSLLTFLLSADSRVMVKACEGVMIVASLPSDKLAQLVVEQSNLCVVLASRLQSTFRAIPLDVEPNDLDDVHINWGLDSPVWGNGSEFHGCRPVAAFLAWLDYCNQLVRESHPIIGSSLAHTIQKEFLEGVMEEMIKSNSYNPVLVTAFISKALKQTTAPSLLTVFVNWLIGESLEPELPGVVTCPMRQFLLDNCLHEHDDVSLETLRLFEVLIDKPNEHILQCLVLTYLKGRNYYNASATEVLIESWSDEEDEREKNKDSSQLDFSPGSSPVSRTLAPSNIHKIINSFLFLLPQHLHSTVSPMETGYQQYIQDANHSYRTCLSRCAHNSWPTEATFPESTHSEGSGSADSHPEADNHRRFFEGPFLRMIFTRLGRLHHQPYEINLQVTGLVSRLGMLPHPFLHEFILNPLLPLTKGACTVFTTLQSVADDLVQIIPTVENYQDILLATRHKLLGDDVSCTQEESNTLFESFIVLEEFCKELAAISFVKYHHSS